MSENQHEYEIPAKKSKWKYKSYTIREKLVIINLTKSKSIRKVGIENGIPESNIWSWIKQEDHFKELLRNKNVKINSRKRLFGGGKSAQFEEMEDFLMDFINDRNKKGLTVKSKYLKIQALKIKEENVEMIKESIENCIDEDTIKDLELLKEKWLNFQASNGWCDNFKSRRQLSTRRQTSCRNLPDDFQHVAVNFVRECQELIQVHKIKPENILNMDQIPRMLENEPSTTITKKGSRDVFLKKEKNSPILQLSMLPVSCKQSFAFFKTEELSRCCSRVCSWDEPDWNVESRNVCQLSQNSYS